MNRKKTSLLVAVVAMLGLGYATSGLSCEDCDDDSKPQATTTAQAQTPAVTYTATFVVDGMTCGGCSKGLARAFKRETGVTDAKVLFAEGKATVTFDPSVAKTAQFIALVNSSGQYKTPAKPESLSATAYFTGKAKTSDDAKLRAMLKPLKGISALNVVPGGVTVAFNPAMTAAQAIAKKLSRRGLQLSPLAAPVAPVLKAKKAS